MFKLRELHINSYKNLSGDFDFSNNKGYIALIGLNGSGKSNLIEAISIIFDKLINNNGYNISFDYSIEYELNGHIYTRKKREAKKDGTKCSPKELEYPTNLIGCYSGEDLRLWNLAFKNYYMGYFNDAVKKTYSSPVFLYINKYCWSIALISLVCSNNSDVKDFLLNALKINSPEDVEIDFAIDDTKKGTFNAHSALNWFNRITQDGLEEINMNTIATSDIYVNAHQVPESEKAKYIFNFLYLLSQPKKDNKDENGKPKKNGKRNNIDKLINRIKIRVNSNGTSIDFNDLSEGQKKLILIECITKVLGDENSLVLLDEPDAHTHIAMKKDLLKLISEFEGQTIMTTHSPMFLNKDWSGYVEGNIYYMHDGKIENTNPLKHLSDLTDNEIDYFKGSFILSSKKILVVEGKYDDKYLRKAIEIFSKTDEKYKKLNDVVMFSANGASEAEVIYKQSLEPCINRIEKIVFLFDYDDAGWKDGWKKIKSISDSEPKIIPLFYQRDYSSPDYPTSDDDVKTANNQQKAIKKSNSFMVEDIFSKDAYFSVIQPVTSARSYHEFNNLTIGKKGTAGAIKEHIEKNYDRFDASWFDGFKTVLDKLIDVFDL